MEIKEPKTLDDRTKLAKELYEQLKGIRDTKDVANWYEGKIFFYFDKYKLHDYLFGKVLSKTAFYAEIDIPVSTVNFKRSIYDFYIDKHKFKIEDLKEANTKKLHRALKYIQNETTKKVEEIIALAKREERSLGDFLESIGAPSQYCLHSKKKKVEKEECEECHKIVNGNGKDKSHTKVSKRA